VGDKQVVVAMQCYSAHRSPQLYTVISKHIQAVLTCVVRLAN